jgi:hypothetical protein
MILPGMGAEAVFPQKALIFRSLSISRITAKLKQD